MELLVLLAILLSANVLAQFNTHEAYKGNTAERRASSDEYRYLTSKTSPYLIDSLPDVDFDVNELYGGSVSSFIEGLSSNSC
jgi:hypothetical protein